MEKYYKSDFIDKGTFGRVYKLTSANAIVADKKYTEANISSNIINEIVFLHSIKHENIIEKIEVLFSDENLHLIMPFYELNLFNWVNNNFKKIDYKDYLQQVDKIFNNILSGLEYIHRNHYIHADIKPTNIMLNTDLTKIKLIDFGLTYNRVIMNNFYIHDIQTIWYRAPEMLKKEKYDYKIDIWSLGLIYLEMLYGEPILKGDNDAMQLSLINNFNIFDFIIDNFAQPADIFHQTKLIYKMLILFPSLRYSHPSVDEWEKYDYNYLLKNEKIINVGIYNKITKYNLYLLFKWIWDLSKIFNNQMDVAIYSFNIVILTLLAKPKLTNLKLDLQFIGLASLIIADNIFNVENVSEKRLLKYCKDELQLKTLIETEFEILILLGDQLQILTALNALHFYRIRFPDVYLDNQIIINTSLCYLCIAGIAFQYKPSYLIAGLFYQTGNDAFRQRLAEFSGYNDSFTDILTDISGIKQFSLT